MTEVIRSGRALAFIGTGVTCPLGYPDWDGLIRCLASELRAARGEEIESNGQTVTVEQVLREFRDKPLVQAQILKENLEHQYFLIMANLFGPKDRRIAPIVNLVSLPFKHLLTSNYDPGLEQHHSPPNEPVSICLHHAAAPQFIVGFSDDDYSRRIVHVHGRYDEARHIILTEEDYGAYIRSAVLDDFWRVVPAAARLVFFGFGFKDIDLLYSFRRRQMALVNNQGNARHFAVMPLDDPGRDNALTIQMRMEYGIEPVFFSHRPHGSFVEYDEFISRLKLDIVGRVSEQLAEELGARPVHVVAAPAAAEILEQDQAALAEAVSEGVEHLKQMTSANIGRRRTGDLE